MDDKRFARALTRAGKKLNPTAYAWTRCREDALDLLQEAIFKAYRYRHTFKPGTSLQGWLYVIMRNVFFTQYRRFHARLRMHERVAHQAKEHRESLHARQHGAWMLFFKGDVSEAIQVLDKRYRQPFLWYLQGFKYAEIAEEMGIPLGTVKTRIHLAKKELRIILRAYADS